jgi:cell division septal protein FtsQ
MRPPGQFHDILHLHTDGREYVVLVSDEALENLTLDECKAIAERKIEKNPSVKQVEVRSTDR